MKVMRCPHCAGEIPAGSRFCGICGRSIAPAPPAYGSPASAEAVPPPPANAPQVGAARAGAAAVKPREVSSVDSVSLFQLPSSRSGRRTRTALVLLLDAILAGAGVVMLLAYLESRRGVPPAPLAAHDAVLQAAPEAPSAAAPALGATEEAAAAAARKPASPAAEAVKPSSRRGADLPRVASPSSRGEPRAGGSHPPARPAIAPAALRPNVKPKPAASEPPVKRKSPPRSGRAPASRTRRPLAPRRLASPNSP